MDTKTTPEVPADAPPLPQLPGIPLDAVGDYAKGLVERAAARAGYAVTGYVLTQKTRGAKCIVDGDTAAWLTADAAKNLLAWKRPKHEAPPEWVDEAPPADVSEGERALQLLATRLGIPYNTMIPHNAGWFVPGTIEAYKTAGEAIEALFERIYTAPDATVYRPGKPGRGAGLSAPIVVNGDLVCSGTVTTAADLFTAAPAPVVTKTTPKAKTAPQVAEPPAQFGLF
jgi:hypothetical protein